jgi:hypothetical protein
VVRRNLQIVTFLDGTCPMGSLLPFTFTTSQPSPYIQVKAA